MNDDLNKKIIEDFGLGNMDPEEQERMIEKIGNLLFENVVERAVDSMDDEVMKDFDDLLESAGSDYEKVVSFLKNRVPNFDVVVSDELSRLKRATSGIFS